MAPRSNPPLGERVASLETSVNDLKGTVEVGFRDLKIELQRQSLNGRTEKAKALVDDVGDADSRTALKVLIRGHDRKAWLMRPVVLVALAIMGPTAGFLIAKFWP